MLTKQDTFWCASVRRLPPSGALPTRADAALLRRAVASPDRHKRIVGCGPSGRAAYHARATNCLISFNLKGSIYYYHYSYYSCHLTVILFWKLSALVCRLEVPEFIICANMTPYFASVLSPHMQQRLIPQVQILVYSGVHFS